MKKELPVGMAGAFASCMLIFGFIGQCIGESRGEKKANAACLAMQAKASIASNSGIKKNSKPQPEINPVTRPTTAPATRPVAKVADTLSAYARDCIMDKGVPECRFIRLLPEGKFSDECPNRSFDIDFPNFYVNKMVRTDNGEISPQVDMMWVCRGSEDRQICINQFVIEIYSVVCAVPY